MDPRLHARDQVELLGAAMDLPDGERGETGHKEDRGEVEGDQRRDPSARQGFCSASCGDIGIMFWSMWYMTHIEPTSVMTTRMSVNVRDMKVHPPSDFVFMCRK
jgi:hypothetical protein